MKKSTLIHIAVIIGSAILASITATKALEEQRKIAPAYTEVTKSPLGGLQSFLADVEWMFFINYRASLKAVDESNVEELIRRIEKMIALDPNFEKIYTVAVPFIASQRPEKAIEILKKACENEQLRKNYKIPLYLSLVYNRMKKAEGAEPNTQDILKYSEMAYQSDSSATYILNSIIRNRARLALKNKKNRLVSQKHAELFVLFEEWKRSGSAESTESPDGSMDMDEAPIIEELEHFPIPAEELNSRLLSMMQQLQNSKDKNSAVQRTLNTIKREVFKNSRLSPYTFKPYEPGDRFCPDTGKPLDVYGACSKADCSEILRGRFCTKCGTDSLAKSE